MWSTTALCVLEATDLMPAPNPGTPEADSTRLHSGFEEMDVSAETKKGLQSLTVTL